MLVTARLAIYPGKSFGCKPCVRCFRGRVLIDVRCLCMWIVAYRCCNCICVPRPFVCSFLGHGCAWNSWVFIVFSGHVWFWHVLSFDVRSCLSGVSMNSLMHGVHVRYLLLSREKVEWGMKEHGVVQVALLSMLRLISGTVVAWGCRWLKLCCHTSIADCAWTWVFFIACVRELSWSCVSVHIFDRVWLCDVFYGVLFFLLRHQLFAICYCAVSNVNICQRGASGMVAVCAIASVSWFVFCIFVFFCAELQVPSSNIFVFVIIAFGSHNLVRLYHKDSDFY